MRPDEILGKTVLVGLTYVRADGRAREKQQLYGLVVSADEERGVDIRQPSGEIITLPPTLESFAVADPGAYTLRSTGEVVTDPDLLVDDHGAAGDTVDHSGLGRPLRRAARFVRGVRRADGSVTARSPPLSRHRFLLDHHLRRPP